MLSYPAEFFLYFSMFIYIFFESQVRVMFFNPLIIFTSNMKDYKLVNITINSTVNKKPNYTLPKRDAELNIEIMY